jgi:hypothetical protein
MNRAGVIGGVLAVLAATVRSQPDGAAESSTSGALPARATNAIKTAAPVSSALAPTNAQASLSISPVLVSIRTNLPASAKTAQGASLSTSAGPTGNDYASFKIVVDRNIFDPNRRKGGGPSIRRTEGEKPPAEDMFSLTGILSSGKGTFAFFDGSSSSFRSALQTKASIGGCKITKIDPPDRIELDVTGKKVELTVGMTMRRPPGGAWKLGGMSESFADSGSSGRRSSSDFVSRIFRTRDSGTFAPSSSDSPTDTTASDASAPAGGMSEALKRLMQKREQELKNGNP